FSAGWYASDGADSPEILEVALDKERYLPGDTANVTIEPDGAGKAFIAVIGNGLLAMQEVDVPAGGVTVPFKVDDKWGPGAYALAMFYRPMDIKAKRMPNRSVGVKWLALDQSHRTIVPKLELPEKVASATTLDVPIRLDGLEKGEEAYIVVAAVDVGILNLTRFKTPAPDKWFYAQRRLGTEIRDLYGRLIDGMRATRGAVRSGGDGGGMTAQGSPPVEAPLSLFSGMVKASADGMAHVTFDLPEFNGTIRLMAMAWSGNKVGHASGDVIVRDPVAMLVTAPRFLTMGDESRVQVDLHNVEGAAGTYRVTVVADDDREGGRLVLDRELALAANERKFHEAPIRATRVGRTTYLVRATGPDGIDVQRRIALDVKAPAPSVRRRTVKTLAAKGGKLTVSADLFGDLIAERSTVTVSAGPAAQLDVAGLMVSLDRYPYGCAEQTTSKALPLLYLSSLSSRLGLAPEADLRGRVQKAIDRVLELQASSGGFGLWSPIGGDIWLTSYIADFLTRAREQGYDVRKGAYEQALDRLQNYVNFVSDFEKGGEQVAYALYVLARTGRAPIGDLRYYVDTRLERFSTPLAKAQLGAALAMYGDKTRARTAIAAAMTMLAPNTLNLSRGDYGSQLRDRAATLTLVAETGAAPASVPKLTELVATALNTKSNTTTQENAWMLLAARSLMERADGLRLSVDGVSQKGSVLKGVSASDLERAPIIIENDGEEPATVVVSVTGEAATPEPATMQGLRVERSYFTLDGKPVDMASGRGGESRLAQNQRLVVVLKVEVTDGSGGRLLLVDRLAGGLEIENPRIVDSANLRALDWLQTTVYPEHTEFRDDRFVASFNLWPGSGNEKSNALTLAYMVRAVSPGRYLHPPATVEDMYRGERFARTSSGTLHIDKAE
ncbi:MAG: alpha-2-macroglobulin family protein, partial [Hyphomicrobiaceae bacterium]